MSSRLPKDKASFAQACLKCKIVLLMASEDGVDLERVEEMSRLLADKHRLIPLCSRQLPQLVSDVILGHKFLGARMMLIDDPHHLKKAQCRQRTGSLQHLHNNTSKPSNCHFNLHNMHILVEYSCCACSSPLQFIMGPMRLLYT